MAKKDELAFEGGVESPQPNKLRKRLYHENG